MSHFKPRSQHSGISCSVVWQIVTYVSQEQVTLPNYTASQPRQWVLLCAPNPHMESYNKFTAISNLNSLEINLLQLTIYCCKVTKAKQRKAKQSKIVFLKFCYTFTIPEILYKYELQILTFMTVTKLLYYWQLFQLPKTVLRDHTVSCHCNTSVAVMCFNTS